MNRSVQFCWLLALLMVFGSFLAGCEAADDDDSSADDDVSDDDIADDDTGDDDATGDDKTGDDDSSLPGDDDDATWPDDDDATWPDDDDATWPDDDDSGSGDCPTGFLCDWVDGEVYACFDEEGYPLFYNECDLDTGAGCEEGELAAEASDADGNPVCICIVACEPGTGDDDDATWPDDDDATWPDDDDVTGDDDMTGDDDDAGWGPDEGASWTFMVYMSADNNLEEYGMDDLQEMMNVGSNDSLTILVLSDRSPGYVTENVGGIADWTSSKLIKVEKGSLTELDDWGELDMGDPKNLVRFIEYGIKNYPADRYGIDFWNHGGAWLGFGWDDTDNHDALNLAEIRQGLQDGLAAGGHSHFDLIGFDACLMASFEIIETVSGLSRYLLASEELEPGHGWNYEGLQAVASDPSINGAEAGHNLLNGFIDQAQAWGTGGNLTLSVVNLAGVPRLRGAINDAVAELKGKMGDYSSAIINAHKGSPAYGSNPDPYQAFHTLDLRTLMAGIQGFDATAIEQAVDSMVLYNHAGPYLAGSSGISIYFPGRVDYYNQGYESVPKMAEWRSFLKAFWGVGESKPTGPTFTNPDKIAEVEFGNPPELTVKGHLDPATTSNLYSVSFSFSVVVGGDELVFGWVPAGFDSGQSMVHYTWDTSAVTITQQGRAEAEYAYHQVDFTNTQGVFKLSVPLAYFPNGDSDNVDAEVEWAQWEISFDGGSGAIIEDLLYLYGEDNVGQLSPVEGSQFLPLVYVYDLANPDDAGWEMFDVTPFDATQQLQMQYAYLPTDVSYLVYLFADDTAGKTDAVYAEIQNQ